MHFSTNTTASTHMDKVIVYLYKMNNQRNTPLSDEQILPACEIVLDKDHQGPVCCPPKEVTDTWREHPRIYMALKPDGSVLCPYCSTLYKRPQA